MEEEEWEDASPLRQAMVGVFPGNLAALPSLPSSGGGSGPTDEADDVVLVPFKQEPEFDSTNEFGSVNRLTALRRSAQEVMEELSWRRSALLASLATQRHHNTVANDESLQLELLSMFPREFPHLGGHPSRASASCLSAQGRVITMPTLASLRLLLANFYFSFACRGDVREWAGASGRRPGDVEPSLLQATRAGRLGGGLAAAAWATGLPLAAIATGWMPPSGAPPRSSPATAGSGSAGAGGNRNSGGRSDSAGGGSSAAAAQAAAPRLPWSPFLDAPALLAILRHRPRPAPHYALHPAAVVVLCCSLLRACGVACRIVRTHDLPPTAAAVHELLAAARKGMKRYARAKRKVATDEAGSDGDENDEKRATGRVSHGRQVLPRVVSSRSCVLLTAALAASARADGDALYRELTPAEVRSSMPGCPGMWLEVLVLCQAGDNSAASGTSAASMVTSSAAAAGAGAGAGAGASSARSSSASGLNPRCRWVCVDPVRQLEDRPDVYEQARSAKGAPAPGARPRSHPLLYATALSAEGILRDVTPTYAARWSEVIVARSKQSTAGHVSCETPKDCVTDAQTRLRSLRKHGGARAPPAASSRSSAANQDVDVAPLLLGARLSSRAGSSGSAGAIAEAERRRAAEEEQIALAVRMSLADVDAASSAAASGPSGSTSSNNAGSAASSATDSALKRRKPHSAKDDVIVIDDDDAAESVNAAAPAAKRPRAHVAPDLGAAAAPSSSASSSLPSLDAACAALRSSTTESPSLATGMSGRNSSSASSSSSSPSSSLAPGAASLPGLSEEWTWWGFTLRCASAEPWYRSSAALAEAANASSAGAGAGASADAGASGASGAAGSLNRGWDGRGYAPTSQLVQLHNLGSTRDPSTANAVTEAVFGSAEGTSEVDPHVDEAAAASPMTVQAAATAENSISRIATTQGKPAAAPTAAVAAGRSSSASAAVASSTGRKLAAAGAGAVRSASAAAAASATSAATREPFPTSKEGFKRSLTYVIPDILHADEVLHPAATSLGFFKGQRIYSRADVQACLSADTWFQKHCRIVKPDELARPARVRAARGAPASSAGSDVGVPPKATTPSVASGGARGGLQGGRASRGARGGAAKGRGSGKQGRDLDGGASDDDDDVYFGSDGVDEHAGTSSSIAGASSHAAISSTGSSATGAHAAAAAAGAAELARLIRDVEAEGGSMDDIFADNPDTSAGASGVASAGAGAGAGAASSTSAPAVGYTGDGTPLYGRWQTEAYRPPPYTPGDPIPVSERGSFELWRGDPAYLPAGLVHVPESEAADIPGASVRGIAYKAVIPCAIALVGFERRANKWIPQHDGVIVSKDDAKRLRQLLLERQQEALLKEIEEQKQAEKDAAAAAAAAAAAREHAAAVFATVSGRSAAAVAKLGGPPAGSASAAPGGMSLDGDGAADGAASLAAGVPLLDLPAAESLSTAVSAHPDVGEDRGGDDCSDRRLQGRDAGSTADTAHAIGPAGDWPQRPLAAIDGPANRADGSLGSAGEATKHQTTSSSTAAQQARRRFYDDDDDEERGDQ